MDNCDRSTITLLPIVVNQCAIAVHSDHYQNALILIMMLLLSPLQRDTVKSSSSSSSHPIKCRVNISICWSRRKFMYQRSSLFFWLQGTTTRRTMVIFSTFTQRKTVCLIITPSFVHLMILSRRHTVMLRRSIDGGVEEDAIVLERDHKQRQATTRRCLDRSTVTRPY